MTTASTDPVVVGVRSPPGGADPAGRGTPAGGGNPTDRADPVRLAAREAGLRGARLLVVHVFAWPRAPLAADTDFGGSRRAARQLVRDAAEEAALAVPGLAVSGEVLDGDTLPTLLRLSRRARLLVLGAERLSRTVSLPTDSLPVQVAARAAVPVMVAAGPGRAGGPVVVGVDHSPATVPAVELAAEEAALRGCPLVVLYAVGDGQSLAAWPDLAACPGLTAGPGLAASPGVAASPGLAVSPAAAARLAGHPEVVVTHRRVELAPAPALIRESRRAQLVVVGVRGWRGTLLGPVTQALLRHSGCPVVVTRVPAPRQRPAPSDRSAVRPG